MIDNLITDNSVNKRAWYLKLRSGVLERVIETINLIEFQGHTFIGKMKKLCIVCITIV